MKAVVTDERGELMVFTSFFLPMEKRRALRNGQVSAIRNVFEAFEITVPVRCANGGPVVYSLVVDTAASRTAFDHRGRRPIRIVGGGSVPSRTLP